MRARISGKGVYKRTFGINAQSQVTAKMKNPETSKNVILKVGERDCINAGSKDILNKKVTVAGREMKVKEVRYNAKKGEIEIKFR